MRFRNTFAEIERHDPVFAKNDGIEVGIGCTLFLTGDADAMERLAQAAAKSARLQRSQVQLPGCDGSSMPGAA